VKYSRETSEVLLTLDSRNEGISWLPSYVKVKYRKQDRTIKIIGKFKRPLAQEILNSTSLLTEGYKMTVTYFTAKTSRKRTPEVAQK
jgi:hypothetical protein